MHEIEPTSFCTYREYRRYFELRKQANDISLGGLFQIMADIRRAKNEKEAIKIPIRVKQMELAGLYVARIVADILNDDFQPSCETTFMINDGISKKPEIKVVSTEQWVKEMYIRDYEDYMSIGPSDDSIEQELSVFGELALAK